MRVGNTIHTQQRVDSLTPACVSVKFWSAPVQIWAGFPKRKTRRSKADEDKVFDLDSDGDVAAVVDDVGGDLADLDVEDVGDVMAAELEALHGELGFSDGGVGDVIDEAALRVC